MKIGLLNVGNGAWIGGVYYISNLVLAIQRLPGIEQPELAIIGASRDSEKLYEDMDARVEFVSSAPTSTHTLTNQLKHRVYHLLAGNQTLLNLSRRLSRTVVPTYYASVENLVYESKASLIFPCLDAPPASFPTPWIGWAWDMQHKYHPDFFTKSEVDDRDHAFVQLAEKAKLIVTSSQQASNDFDQYFPGAKDKLRVLHFRVVPKSGWYEPQPEQMAQKYHLPDRYLLLPNQFWVHKNHRLVFEAVKILRSAGTDVCLVCTGNTSDPRRPHHFAELSDFIKENGLERHILILGFIPRSDQIQLIRGAAAIIQPSLFEGWSTVVEDARALGKTIFLSDIPVHREQNPPHTIFIHPADPAALAEQIKTRWASLQRGPNLVQEQAAAAIQNELVSTYARDFLGIASEIFK